MVVCGCRRSGDVAPTVARREAACRALRHTLNLIHAGEAMSILGSNFLFAAANVLGFALNMYMWIIIARAVLSWVSPDPYNPIVRFVHAVTEPVLSQVRRRLPASFGGMDLSPVIVLLVIMFLERFVVDSLHQLAAGVR
jgi:YggT family protein